MIQYIVLFTFNFVNIYFIGSRFANNFGLLYKDFISFVLKINSVIHGLCICVISVKYLQNHITSDVFLSYIEITRGYLFYDLIMIIIFRKKISDFKLILIHHLIFFTALHSPLLCEHPILVAKGLCAEVTNLFLYLGWYLVKIRRDNSALFFVNGALLLMLFFIYRVLTFVNLFVLSLGVENIVIEQVCLFGIMLLNLIWFVKLLEKFFTSLILFLE